MKKPIVIILFMLPIILSAQWEIIHRNKYEYFTSIDLVNDTLGFATSNNGQIIRTTDGGKTWNNLVKLSGELSEIQFVDEYNGWVIAVYKVNNSSINEYSRLFQSRNGGMNWEELTYDISQLDFIQFVTDEIGWAISSTGEKKIVKTIDGGRHWIKADSNISMQNYVGDVRISFYDDKIGWICDENNLYKTIDSGNNWENVLSGHRIESILAVNDSTCYLQIEDTLNYYLVTHNGGFSWQKNIPENSGVQPREIQNWVALNDSTIFLSARSYTHAESLFKTENRFKSCEIIDLIENIGNHDVDFFDNESGFWTNGSSIYSTHDQGLTWEKVFKTLNNLNYLKFISEMNGFMISDGAISLPYSTKDGGHNWEEIDCPNIINGSEDTYTPYRLGILAIYFISQGDGFLAGNNEILYTNNGGKEWKNCTNNLHGTHFGQVTQIYFSNELLGFAFTTPPFLNTVSSLIYKTDDGGKNWKKIDLGSGLLTGIDFIDDSIGIIVGENKVIYKTMDGGESWESYYMNQYVLKDIDQISNINGYACGYIIKNYKSCSVILRSNDCWGNADKWFKQYEKEDAYLNSIYMLDSLKGYVCGCYYDEEYEKYGYILKTIDGGSNWEENYTIRDIELNDIQFIDENTGWAVGEKGMVLRTTNGGATWVEKKEDNIPNKIVLCQNYPNPFNPTTTIKYSLPIEVGGQRLALSEVEVSEFVNLTIYDVLGRKVETLINQKQKPGSYEVEWSADQYPSGVYFYKLDVGDYQAVKKMLLIK